MKIQSKNFANPDDTHSFEKLVQHVVEIGDLTVGHIVTEPGWRWSTHVRPRVGGEWCQARHVGVILSGRLGLTFPDGSTAEIGPNEVFEIPPGHDGYTVGDEPCVQIEWTGPRAFITSQSGAGRTLAAILFSDIVGSTEMASRLGDTAWRALLSSHFESMRGELDRYRGREVKTAGDGLLATFDGPALALSCATAMRRLAVRDGLKIRIGVHVGEIERVGNDVRGIAVHEAARIMAQSSGEDIVVSDLTRAIAAAAGFSFEDRGVHVLKGLPGDWRLHALCGSGPT
jgi:class 3 adenylate cyclase